MIEFKENHSTVEWKLIAGMRHILVHDYYRVSPSELWMVVQNDIDNLKRELECFLEEF